MSNAPAVWKRSRVLPFRLHTNPSRLPFPVELAALIYTFDFSSNLLLTCKPFANHETAHQYWNLFRQVDHGLDWPPLELVSEPARARFAHHFLTRLQIVSAALINDSRNLFAGLFRSVHKLEALSLCMLIAAPFITVEAQEDDYEEAGDPASEWAIALGLDLQKHNHVEAAFTVARASGQLWPLLARGEKSHRKELFLVVSQYLTRLAQGGDLKRLHAFGREVHHQRPAEKRWLAKTLARHQKNTHAFVHVFQLHDPQLHMSNLEYVCQAVVETGRFDLMRYVLTSACAFAALQDRHLLRTSQLTSEQFCRMFEFDPDLRRYLTVTEVARWRLVFWLHVEGADLHIAELLSLLSNAPEFALAVFQWFHSQEVETKKSRTLALSSLQHACALKLAARFVRVATLHSADAVVVFRGTPFWQDALGRLHWNFCQVQHWHLQQVPIQQQVKSDFIYAMLACSV
jgi:hypothetical protein